MIPEFQHMISILTMASLISHLNELDRFNSCGTFIYANSHMQIASKYAFNFTNVTDLLLHFLQIQSDKLTFWLSLRSHQLPSVVIK
jgi:hypothetical protein